MVKIKLILEIITSLGTMLAVIVAMVAINYTNKNSKEEIITNKLEELLESIKYLSKYYAKLKILNNEVINLRNENYKELETLSQYFKIRDRELPLDEREKLFEKLFRIEVLAKCYTKGNLKDEILKFEDLVYTMAEIASYGASIQEHIKWKNGFPTYEIFYEILNNLEKQIINQISSKK